MPARPDPLAAPLPVASERVYADADGKIVKADDPARATLVAAAGTQVPERYRGAYESFAAEAEKAEEPAGTASATETAAETEEAAAEPADTTEKASGGKRSR